MLKWCRPGYTACASNQLLAPDRGGCVMNYETLFEGSSVPIDGAAAIAAAAARYEQAVRLMHEAYWRRHAVACLRTKDVGGDTSQKSR